jgi:hypothetical protein
VFKRYFYLAMGFDNSRGKNELDKKEKYHVGCRGLVIAKAIEKQSNSYDLCF